MVLMFAALWAIVILPQQRKAKAQRAMLAALQEGDLVLTSSGIYGVIVEFPNDTDVYLEVAQGIELRLTRSSILGKARVGTEAEAATAEAPAAKPSLFGAFGRGRSTELDDKKKTG